MTEQIKGGYAERRKNSGAVFESLCSQNATTPKIMRHPSRLAGLVKKRKAIMHAMRSLGFSYPEIGRVCDRHHTTVLSNVRSYQNG